jgi:hypothetical protein
MSAEAWYFANVKPADSMQHKIAVMQQIIETKLRQQFTGRGEISDLMKAIDEKGGANWIASTEHTVNGGRWEGKGLDSPFLKVLHDAYNAVKAEQAKPAPTAPTKPATPLPPIFKTGRTHTAHTRTKPRTIKELNAARVELDAAKKAGDKARLEFLKMIRDMGGMEVTLASDIIGEKGIAINRVGGGVFRKDGRTIDHIIHKMVEKKYMTQEDVDSDAKGGEDKAIALIKSALHGEIVAPLDELGEIKGRIAAAQEVWANEGRPAEGTLAEKKGRDIVKPNLSGPEFEQRMGVADKTMQEFVDSVQNKKVGNIRLGEKYKNFGSIVREMLDDPDVSYKDLINHIFVLGDKLSTFAQNELTAYGTKALSLEDFEAAEYRAIQVLNKILKAVTPISDADEEHARKIIHDAVGDSVKDFISPFVRGVGAEGVHGVGFGPEPTKETIGLSTILLGTYKNPSEAMRKTANHEVLHAVITRIEREYGIEAAKKIIDAAQAPHIVKQVLESADNEIQQEYYKNNPEEMLAEAYGLWATGKLKLDAESKLAQFFTMLKNLVLEIFNKLQGDPLLAETFAAIKRGELHSKEKLSQEDIIASSKERTKAGFFAYDAAIEGAGSISGEEKQSWEKTLDELGTADDPYYTTMKKHAGPTMWKLVRARVPTSDLTMLDDMMIGERGEADMVRRTLRHSLNSVGKEPVSTKSTDDEAPMSQQAAETPGWNPPPGVQAETLKKIIELAGKMFGKKVNVEFGSRPGSTARGWYQSHRQLSGFKANEAKIKEIRERRRDALKAGDDAQVKVLNAQEASLLKQNEVVGTIFLNANLANREMFPTYYHEALHAAFDILLTPAEKAVLGTAFSQGTVRRQLELLFANDPAVLAQMKDAEEAAAYGFQIYAAAPHLIQLGPKVTGMFSKVAHWFRKMLGMLSPDEKAQIIMAEMLSGRRSEGGLSPLQRLLDKDSTFQQKVAKHATAVRELLQKLWEIVATPSYDRLVGMGIPALTKLAKLGHTKTGEKGDLGMIQRLQNEISARFNWVNKITKKYSEEQIKEVAEHRMNGTYPTDPELQKAYKDIDTFFNEFRKYAKDAGVKIGFIKNYWPMLWDAEKVMKGRDEFLKMISQPKYAAHLDTLKVTPTELWENISGYITRGDSFQGIMSPTGEPVNSYSSERSLSFLDPDDRKPFMHDSPYQTMINYVSHMVRQAEFVRAYGKNGEIKDALLTEAVEKWGATPEQIVLANDYIDGLLGNKEVGMSRELKDLYGAAIVYQNYRLLPFNLFTSFVDPLGIAIRSGRLSDALETFIYAMKNLFRDLKKNRPDMSKDEYERLAEDWGYIEDAGTMANLRHMMETTELRGITKKMNDALFKWNLLNGWTRSTKIMAVKAGQRFIARVAKGADATDRRHLEELGLKPSDVIETQDGNIALRKDEFMAQGMSEDQAEQAERRMRDAMTKFVNQSILNPNAADLPNWGSNPYLAPIFHLKQFMFTFQTTIMSRVIQEAMQGNIKPMLIAGIYIPGIMGADALRGFISNMGEQPPWQKNWGPVDYVKNGVARSGLLGSGQMFASMWDDVSHGGRGYESGVGPTVEQFMKGLQAVSRGDTALWNFTVKSMPLAPIYDQWLISSKPGPMGNHFGSSAASATSK